LTVAKYKLFNSLTTKAADLNCAGFSNGTQNLAALKNMCTQKYLQQKGTKGRTSSTTGRTSSIDLRQVKMIIKP
jgi:hypothetical protein